MRAVYEKKTLTWVTDGRDSASASELLRAVAFCLAGSYRKVGTVFVLTEDVMGVGTRRQIIQDFEEACEAERHQAVKDAQKAIKENPAQKKLKLNSFGDPLAMDAKQEKAPSPKVNWHQGLAEAAMPLEELTAGQQTAVEEYQKYVKANPQQFDQNWSPDFSKKVHIIKNTAVQMVINGVDGTVATDFGAELNPLFEPEEKKREPTPDDFKMFENMTKWTDAAKVLPRRAVICKSLTTADVDASLLRIEKMGFNQMWLVVFTGGKARVPGTPFPLDPGCDPKTDLLTYAIDAGKKKGIAVSPVVDVYSWGKDTPKELRLLTLRGEDSAQSAIRRFQINALMPPNGAEEFNPLPKNAAPSSAVFVDPTDSRVQASLTGLLRAIAFHAGAGKIVCGATKPEGFSGQDGWSPMRFRAEMGYNSTLRLAHLRKYHKDPVDLHSPYNMGNYARANTTLGDFEGYDYEPMQNWGKMRAEALKTAWQSLFDSLWSSTGDARPALFIGQDDGQGFMNWYDEWNDPKTSLPNGNLYQASQPEANAKPGAAPKPPSGVLLLSKQTPVALPKELAKYDWMDIQMKILDFYKQFRTWDGIAIEE